MKVLLVVDRAKAGPGIWALAWTDSEDDPRLIESRHFLGEEALQAWLEEISARFGPGSIAVDWSDSLRADARLTAVMQRSLDPGVGRR
jgi:hypothetical protein